MTSTISTAGTSTGAWSLMSGLTTCRRCAFDRPAQVVESPTTVLDDQTQARWRTSIQLMERRR
jgi:hypothetical protein